MELVFPEIEHQKEPDASHREDIIEELAQENKSYNDWLFEAESAKIEQAAEKRARKEKQEMKNTEREKRERAERFLMLKMGRLLQDNIIAAGRITETVMKAARDGRPPQEIALAAVKGLSLLVNDTMVYTVIEKKYRQEYGITLEPKAPYNIIRLDPDEK